MATITIDPNYGYVLVAVAATSLLSFVHSINTGKYRKTAKVDYPAAYAPEARTDEAAFRFNCAQRAHANYIENMVPTIGALLVSGLKFPLISAVAGGVWVFSRYMYMLGYSTGEQGGKGRYKKGGLLFWLPQFGLMGLSAYTGVSLILGW